MSQPTAFTIAHETPRRIRLSVPALRSRRLAAEVRAALARDPRIAGFEARPVSGSLILHVSSAVSRSAGRADALAAARDALAGASWADATIVSRALAATETLEVSAGAPFHAPPLDTVAGRFGVDPARGLSAVEAAARRRRYGPNRAPEDAPPSRWRLLGKQFVSAPVALLGASATASALSGGGADAVATLAVVAVNAAIGYATEAQAERSIAALIGGAAQPARVRREGAVATIPADEIVPGDVVLLRAGAQVPADARLLAARGLLVD